MAFKVYVAGSSKEIERVRAVMAQLIAGGCEITYDWTQSIDEARIAGFGNNSDADVPTEVRRKCADMDIKAVRCADAVLFLGSEEHNSRGAHVEMGAAIALNKPVVAVNGKHTIFTDATGVWNASSDAAAIEYLIFEVEGCMPFGVAPWAKLDFFSIGDFVARNLKWAHSKGWDERLCAYPAHREQYNTCWCEPKGVDRNGVLAKLALIHTEISEAVEHVRDDKYTIHFKDNEERGGMSKPDGMVVELADAMIRIFHLCGELGLPLEVAVLEKMAYNEGRPNKHGRKA